MIGPRALRSGIGATALILAAAGSAASWPQAARASEVPSLRLVSAERHAVLHRQRGGRVPLAPLGLHVAASGGELRLDVTRPGFRGWRAEQLDPGSGAVLRELPPGHVRSWRGLDEFLRVALLTRAGNRVAATTVSFCPNTGVRQRIDDSGPASPRYPRRCGGGLPFLRGMPWGIAAGWATRPPLGAVKLAPGRYTARAVITAPYRELFEIPLADAITTVPVRVKRARRRPPHTGLARARASAGGSGPERLSVPIVDDPDPATLPDLAALPLWNIRARSRRGRDLITFAASPWNAGPVPLVIEGYRRGRSDLMDAYQYFFDAGGEAIGKAPAGTMAFHRARGHYHWHFLQFARFSLLERGGSSVVRSRKQSYCITATDPVDLTIAGAEWTPRAHGSCGGARSIWIRQKLAPGWADTYYQAVAGQAFDITRVPNGRYLLRIRVNPRGEIRELTDENNIADRMIRLRGKRGARRVAVAPWNGIRR